MVSQADGFAGAAPYSKDVFTKNKAVAKNLPQPFHKSFFAFAATGDPCWWGR